MWGGSGGRGGCARGCAGGCGVGVVGGGGVRGGCAGGCAGGVGCARWVCRVGVVGGVCEIRDMNFKVLTATTPGQSWNSGGFRDDI